MSGKHWTDDEIQILKADYPHLPTSVLAARLGRSVAAVYGHANLLCLYKTKAYLAGPQGCRLQRADHPGKATRFKKGRRPHNKGRSFEVGGDSAKTRFKQGGKPHNWVKIGSERVTKYGYLQRKITDTGYPHRDWVPVHHLLWMDHHGSIPPGFIVVFRNRNKSDLALENLELISRAENMQRNTIHRYPAELKDTIRLASKLQRRLREKQD